MPWAFSVLIIFDFFFFISESLFFHQLAIATLLNLCAKNKMADYQIKGDEVDVFSEKCRKFAPAIGSLPHHAAIGMIFFLGKMITRKGVGCD